MFKYFSAHILLTISLIFTFGLTAACNQSGPPSPPAAPHPAKELVFYGYAEDMPLCILHDFTKEFGVKITYKSYDSPQEAAKNIRAGMSYDVALIDNELVSPLVKEGRLLEIEFEKVPNFKNVSANFRDMAFDPGNRHSIPCSYGTTGLLVRTDLIGKGPSRWADLWDPRCAGKIGLRNQPRDVLGLTLLSLGHTFNSENQQELETALKRLLVLKSRVVILDTEASGAVPLLLSGKISILVGYAEDYLMAREANPAVAYVLPREGPPLWGDSYVISARSPHRDIASAFINYLLRPDIASRIINEKKYIQANDAALAYIGPDIRNNPVICPSQKDLQKGHIILPLSPEGEKRYADIWDRFMKEQP